MGQIPINEEHPLVRAGMTAEQVKVWDERFADSKMNVPYDVWCQGVLALVVESDDGAKVVHDAIQDAVRAGGLEQMVRRFIPQRMVLGSYRVKSKNLKVKSKKPRK